MTTTAQFAGITVRESNTNEPLANIFPERDIESLTGAERDALDARVDDVMRPLVEAEWAKLGAEVEWSSGGVYPAYRILVGCTESVDDEVMVKRLQAAQIDVWRCAYEAMDDDAVWAYATQD